MFARSIAAIVALFVVGAGAPPVRQVASFPVRYSANSRFLVDRAGTPFPILGRTAWFVMSLSEGDARMFLDDTASRGFTAIEATAVNHDSRGNHPPFDGAGHLPFLKRLDGASWTGSLLVNDRTPRADAPDLSTPNEPYWQAIDRELQYCEARGILVFLFPAYVGEEDADQGWMRELVANGPARVQAYGAWIAARYRNQRNLVWMMGGDKGTGHDPFDAEQTRVEAALLGGLKSVPGQQSQYFSAEWSTEAIATDQAAFGTAMTLNGAYSWTGDVNTQGRRAYAHTPIEPAYLLEEPYDEEGPDGNRYNPSAIQPVRRFQWGGWLSTTGGYISGNGYVWPFRESTLRAWVWMLRGYLRGNNRSWPLRAPSWREHLDTAGTEDMTRLNAFVRSIAWHALVPSGLGAMRTLIVGNAEPSAADYVPAAAAPDGTLLVAYVPPAHHGTVTVDLSSMKGSVRARWFDPTSGESVDAGRAAAAGPYAFAPPLYNHAGAADWVLVLER